MDLWNILTFLTDLFLKSFMIPLLWLPDPIVAALEVCIVVFGIVLIGRVLKWLWDALPIA